VANSAGSIFKAISIGVFCFLRKEQTHFYLIIRWIGDLNNPTVDQNISLSVNQLKG
jgi:hypothetical protein